MVSWKRDERGREEQTRSEIERLAGVAATDAEWRRFVTTERPDVIDAVNIYSDEGEEAAEDLRRMILAVAEEGDEGPREQCHGVAASESLSQRLVRVALERRPELSAEVSKWREEAFGGPKPPFPAVSQAGEWITRTGAAEIMAAGGRVPGSGGWETLQWTVDGRFTSCVCVVPGGALDSLRLLSARLEKVLVTSAAEATLLVLVGTIPPLRPVGFSWSIQPGVAWSFTSTVDPRWEQYLPPDLYESRRQQFAAALAGTAKRRTLSLGVLESDLNLAQHARSLPGATLDERWKQWPRMHPEAKRVTRDAYRKAEARAIEIIKRMEEGGPI